MLRDKNIVLGVTGGISAYKVVELARTLTQEGAVVDVVMTEAATKFVTPLTFQTLTYRPVLTDAFRLSDEGDIPHVALGERANLVVIAPATANTIAKLAHGLCDEVLSITVLATHAPVVIVPAMNYRMYANVATQDNLRVLRERGITGME